MKFLLKPFYELTEQDYLNHAIWVCWNDPDEIEDLVSFGYDEDDIRRELDRVGWSDRYGFSIPDHAIDIYFNNKDISINIETANGQKLTGYWNGICLGIFYKNELYTFNENLVEFCIETENKLKHVLNATKLFPMKLEYRANGEMRTYHYLSGIN